MTNPMKKLIQTNLILILFFLSFTANAQLSTAYDEDGYTNIRQTPSVKSKIIGKILEGQVFKINYFFEEENKNTEWVKIEFPINPDPKINDYIKCLGTNEEGFIHRSRIRNLEDLKQFKVNKINSYKVELKESGFTVVIETKPFNKSTHKIKHFNNRTTIDNEIPWGYFEHFETTEIKSISVKKDSVTYIFPKNSFSNLYHISTEFAQVAIGNKNEIYITIIGGDGSDTYNAIWCIKNNKIFSMTVVNAVP